MTATSSIFYQRKILVASKHKKEIVFRPLFENIFKSTLLVAEAFDTDMLGTFSGEIERVYDPITTLRKKCLLASTQYDVDLVLASEGSFGAHPYLFFAAADEEMIMLFDKKHNIELISKELSTETNFNGKQIQSLEELNSFADQCLFPSHRLIIRDQEKGTAYIKKGIGDQDALELAYNDCLTQYGTVFVETDMRAMYNPTRMKVIEACAKKLIDKMLSTCLNCQMPGFSITDAMPGLPCSLCKAPTRSTLKYISVCQHCAYKIEHDFPHQKQEEDPMYCDNCNP